MPRRSAAAGLVPTNLIGAPQYLTPPALLTEPEKRAFTEVVSSKRPQHFETSDLPLLVEFSRLIVAINDGWTELRTADNKTEARAVILQSQKNLFSLARMLKLSPLARVPTTPKRPGAEGPPLPSVKRPWEVVEP